MTKKILPSLSLLVLLITSFSCSKNEKKKETAPSETTSFLLVNEQLPIKTLSNALEWPEEVILGVDLGLIKLNEDGEERLKDIFEDYSQDGKDDFIKDNNQKKRSDFVKGDWIKSETKKISNLKLNDIKKHEFNNNEIIQNKLKSYIPYYIERQTEELSSYQFSFFSKGFWKNLGQISWIHTKSTFWGKFSNWDISYIKPVYKKDLQQKWEGIYNSYFSIKKAENEIKNIAKNYQALLVLKHDYIAKLEKIKTDRSQDISLNQFKFKPKNNINIEPIISQFNLTLVDNFGLWFFEILLGLFTFALVRHILIKLFYADELRAHEERVVFFFDLIHTAKSPITAGLSIVGALGSYLFYEKRDNEIYDESGNIAKNLKTFLGVVLLAVSIWYFPKKQIKLENEINTNLEANFSSHFDKTSIMILDDLNLNTELFFTSI
ncbi:hypothetical protein BC952_1699 [Flavobacterium limicola]|uniref:Uncharacterized protein n=1 Tax=Flavobacterium limicola TaxID=180441 RepID=A0A495S2N2_9FLAO|nr:hypothetical protein [Flavobacterium limicola]RKS93849.1 hypothetical protein BC952_1699 [Flavobacterium limicola]